MPKINYQDHRFGASAEEVIHRSNAIISEYQRQGFSLTLRQLFYQHVSRGWIANKQSEYDRLGNIISDARLAGRIDWNAIEDRTRWLRSSDYDQGDPDTWLSRIATSFSKARWETQPYAVEAWVEKDALVGVLQSACDPLYVPYFACRGYVSQSELWGAAQRIGGYLQKGKEVLILHLGDHDPSGIDMTRDIRDRLNLFLKRDWAAWAITKKWPQLNLPSEERKAYLKERPELSASLDASYWPGRIEIRRLALNMDQVQLYSPPPNPAKLTDSRARTYIDEHGVYSWELDALDPATLSNLITDAIEPLIDQEAWDKVEAEEATAQRRLKLVAKHWQPLLKKAKELSDEEKKNDN